MGRNYQIKKIELITYSACLHQCNAALKTEQGMGKKRCVRFSYTIAELARDDKRGKQRPHVRDHTISDESLLHGIWPAQSLTTALPCAPAPLRPCTIGVSSI